MRGEERKWGGGFMFFFFKFLFKANHDYKLTNSFPSNYSFPKYPPYQLQLDKWMRQRTLSREWWG